MTEPRVSSACQAIQESVYRDLHRIAYRHMSRSPAHPTLQPTMLVHEAWIRMAGRECRSRTHYLALASRAMRHYLIDYLRARTAQKRDGALIRVEMNENIDAGSSPQSDAAIEIEKILRRLVEQDPRKARVVELHVFAGMPLPEIAQELGVSAMTVRRDWQFCRAWLGSVLEQGTP